MSVSDGTSSASTTVSIDIADDDVNAEDDAGGVSESSLTDFGNVLSNDDHANGQVGADGINFDSWADGVAADGATTYGTMDRNADGTWEYTLDDTNADVIALAEGATLTETFVYDVVDGDGDTSTATLTITITGSNDDPEISNDPGTGGTNDEVFESGLPTGSNAGTGLDAVGTFTVSDPDGLDDIESIEVAGQTFTKTPGQTFAQFAQTLVDAAAIDTGYGTLEITGFVGGEFTYEYTLDTTVDNDSQAGATDTGYTESFDVSVSDGTSSASTTVSIDIADDEPQDFTSQSVVVAPGDASTTGALNAAPTSGADGVDTATYRFDGIVDGALVTQGTGQVYLDGEPLQWNVVSDTEVRAESSDGDLAFIVTLNPANDTYTVSSVSSGTFGLSDQEAFPAASTLTQGNDVFYGVQDIGDSSVDVLITAADSGGNQDTVNNSTPGFGVGGGNSIDAQETLSFQFFSDLTATGGSSYNPTVGSTSASVTSFSVTIGRVQGNTAQVAEGVWEASYDGGVTWVQVGQPFSASEGQQVSVVLETATEFLRIRGTGSQSFTVFLNGVGALESADLFIDLATLVDDGDGDSASGTLRIGIDTDNDGQVVGVNAPIGVDLDGDGVEYLPMEDGVVFNDSASDLEINTAWVAPDDGMLVIDANNSGTVDESREYVFTEWSENAETDLQAIAEVFDTNQDGVLDAQDEQFDQFAVWQDADSDGVTDEGELTSLTDLGIESIALTYADDSESGTAADGDVIIHGQSTVTFTDGSTTVAEDTSFAISAADVLSEDDSITLPAGETEESEAGAVESDAGAAGGDSELDAAMIEADLMINSNNDDKNGGYDQ